MNYIERARVELYCKNCTETARNSMFIPQTRQGDKRRRLILMYFYFYFNVLNNDQ